jgi:hypothetical protein
MDTLSAVVGLNEEANIVISIFIASTEFKQ